MNELIGPESFAADENGQSHVRACACTMNVHTYIRTVVCMYVLYAKHTYVVHILTSTTHTHTHTVTCVRTCT